MTEKQCKGCKTVHVEQNLRVLWSESASFVYIDNQTFLRYNVKTIYFDTGKFVKIKYEGNGEAQSIVWTSPGLNRPIIAME